MDELKKILLERKLKGDMQANTDAQNDPGMLANVTNKFKNDYDQFNNDQAQKIANSPKFNNLNELIAHIDPKDQEMAQNMAIGSIGSISKVAPEAKGIISTSGALERFKNLRQALSREGGYAQRLGLPEGSAAPSEMEHLSRSMDRDITGSSRAINPNQQDLAIKLQQYNKFKK